MAEPATIPSTSAAPRPKLLIVDDDAELCSMLAEYLGPEGFVTEAVGSGPVALERLGRDPVDLVVLDVMLPELSGFEVLRRIRSLNRVPVIMLTARGEEVTICPSPSVPANWWHASGPSYGGCRQRGMAETVPCSGGL